MNNLVVKNEKVTSLGLLDEINIFRKQEGNKTELGHNDLLKVIRDEFEEEISLGKISQSTYKNDRGREYPMFELTLSQSKQVLVRESKFVRKAVIHRLEKLEEKVGQKVPTNFKEALLLALEQQEKIEVLEIENKIKEQQISEFKPIKDYVDTILSSEDTMNVSQIGADYGLSGKALNKILHEQSLIRSVGGQWILYTEHMNKGYTKSETTEIARADGTLKIVLLTKYTQKGRLKIHEILAKLGIKANQDKEEVAS